MIILERLKYVCMYTIRYDDQTQKGHNIGSRTFYFKVPEM